MPLLIYLFVGDASGTEVSVKGFRAGVPRRREGTVGEAPSVREEWFTYPPLNKLD